jgi:hypothetical protein
LLTRWGFFIDFWFEVFCYTNLPAMPKAGKPAVRVAQSFFPGIKGIIVILVVVNVDEFTQRVQKVYTKCNGSRV